MILLICLGLVYVYVYNYFFSVLKTDFEGHGEKSVIDSLVGRAYISYIGGSGFNFHRGASPLGLLNFARFNFKKII